MSDQKPLGDLADIILIVAARSQHGFVHPLPVAAGKDRLAIGRAIASLKRRQLVTEVAVTDERHCWRRKGDDMIGLAVTDAGRELVPDVPPQTKTGTIVSLMERKEGATLEDMTGATGWLPHTTRAALTGLRKRGHEIASTKVDGVRTYRVLHTAEAAQ
ncbi:DUF3489 domain-containing protein [Croceicoccus sp. BE223]|uniref:DUF3489 domain-containing protein n=1 Tax=Croceicoccus sp. BE223 TaxID=2817716 RepID=UPI002855ABF1|nr:DUF3489 domain-containing protein [Croceicoccus sp. BE223]MDR7102846.1 hypothetical protein [Croceicoccus sp. BE223]